MDGRKLICCHLTVGPTAPPPKIFPPSRLPVHPHFLGFGAGWFGLNAVLLGERCGWSETDLLPPGHCGSHGSPPKKSSRLPAFLFIPPGTAGGRHLGPSAKRRRPARIVVAWKLTSRPAFRP